MAIFRGLHRNLYSKCRTVSRREIRNSISYWLFGLGNNFSYVIMLSAALDIIKRQEDKPPHHPLHVVPGVNYSEFSSIRLEKSSDGGYHFNCTEMGTGSILLADIIPSLGLKLVAHLFIHKLHFHVKILLTCALALNSFLMVSFSTSMAMSIAGIVSASLSSGIGDISFLSMMAFFHRNCVSAWSSGTGAAGVAGAFVYAALTSALSPEVTLLILTVVPVTIALVYFFLLDRPDHPKFRIRCHCFRAPPEALSMRTETVSRYSTLTEDEKAHEGSSSGVVNPANTITDDEPDLVETGRPKESSSKENESVSQTGSNSDTSSVASSDSAGHVSLQQVHPDWRTKLLIIWDLTPLLVYLTLVYFFEYMINQSLFELLYFPNFTLSSTEQYRWYQVLYQIGVFFSRSSINLFRIRWTWILAVLQGANFVLFLTQVLYRFIPSIWIIFVLILYEGCLGGLSYVNTFFRVIKDTAPAHREFAMAFSAIADALGITVAGFSSIPLHTWLCERVR
ncbi:unnamed protein product [Calicophoron daubneyi]|uniref:Battenin n=1 Tax=Calicophoron daubneyi TaxID=300641 RepID=A0AAV2TG53_CALDB